jgi:hypothetical protein
MGFLVEFQLDIPRRFRAPRSKTARVQKLPRRMCWRTRVTSSDCGGLSSTLVQ